MYYLLLRARAIGNLWSICLRVNILSCLAKSKGHKANIGGGPFPCVAFIGNIPLLKAFRVNSQPS